ncbi:28S ribosomal protein S10, mitochondrial-like [Haliotis rubra]|uniref:28S ribosomal protein S10, mitochondrial-like n=1 Tax=Haliotis rubra TaxID=36100 RepID=UPI001EE55633|nr:28S ribosomal protein S10, mitochondrial-like [Haliotis rubra]
MATRAVGRATVLAKYLNNRILPSVCTQCAKRVTQINRQHCVWSIRLPHVSLSVKHFSSDAQNINPTQITEVEDTDEVDDLYKRIIIEVKGHDPEIIKSYTKFFVMTARELDIPIHDIHTPDKDIERLTLLKSVHIYKKHRVQYETRTHYKQYELLKLTGSTADTLLEYVQRNLPEGMAMKVTKERLERLPDHLQSPLKGSTSTPKATELQPEAS